MRRIRETGLAGMLVASAGLTAAADGPPPELAAMKPGDGREITHAMCSGCHSISLVTQQGLSRERWGKMLDWMAAEQGMPALDPATEARVLTYLSRQYGPDRPRGTGRSPRR